MDKTTGFSSVKPESLTKRDYRILRSKVLKLLDQKFYHPSEDVAQYDAKMLQMQSAFKKIRDQEYMEHLGSNTPFSKIYDYTFYKPDLRTIKYPKQEKSYKKLKELEVLKIDNLCKYLTLDEIELVCEDPIYFLGRQEYRIQGELNDHKGWNKQLGWVKERRKKERNWKESMEQINSDFYASPRVSTFTMMSSRPLRSVRNQDTDFGERKDAKESILKAHSKKIMARNNQMTAIVKIRKMEELEKLKDREFEWEYNTDEKQNKVLEKRQEALDFIIKDKQSARATLEQKLEKKKKIRLDSLQVNKMSLEINQIFKSRMATEVKQKEIQTKIDKARTYSDFKFRKTLFISKGGFDKDGDSSYSQPYTAKERL